MQLIVHRGYFWVGGLKLIFPCASLYFSKFSTRNMLFLFLKMIFKSPPKLCCEDLTCWCGAAPLQSGARQRADGSPGKSGAGPASETSRSSSSYRAEGVATCSLLSATPPPNPAPIITYQAQALCKRQYLKNGRSWSSCQRTKWRCQAPSVIVLVASTGCTCRIPKGEKM